MIKNLLVVGELLFLEVEKDPDNFRCEENHQHFVIEYLIGTFQQLDSEFLWDLCYHVGFHFEISVLLLAVDEMQVVMDISLERPGDVHFLHEHVHEDELVLELVLSGPFDDDDDLVQHVSIHHESEYKTHDGIVGLDWVHWRDISIRNCCYCVYPPIQSVQILQRVRQRNYWRVSSRVVQPTNYIDTCVHYCWYFPEAHNS